MTSEFPSGKPLFSLLEGTRVSAGRHRLTVHGRWADIDVEDDSPLVREALYRMSLGPVSLEHIPVLFAEYNRWLADGFCGPEWPRLKLALDGLGGCVVPSLGLHDGAGPTLSLVAVVGHAEFHWPSIDDKECVELLPGTRIGEYDGERALLRRGAPYAVVLHRAPADRIAELLANGPTTVVELADRLGVDRPLVADVVAYLASAGVLYATDQFPPGGDPPYRR
ncbi:hypothetical protein GCM10022243_14760 [Saccharothrix violaceirubra]|uniref:Uncharacterized protein n=1 Tax=Saccharothrix violaceirubra TaxID=413306 RepID=A0A7W7T8Q2_9PSEU|nr:helix-turn-helix domain-containing protein [Saccharothrix violaceirubra]MBB4967350.1 hypothetical protein [Saccharothrix violaceirubra]